MIEQFPKFSPLSLDQAGEVANFYHPEHHYSDFNFLSIYSWDVDGATKISVCGQGLLIMLPDYISGEISLAYSGGGLVDMLNIINWARINGLPGEIGLLPIPESQEHHDDLSFLDLVDHHDYVYDLNELSVMAGKRYAGKRWRVNQFMKQNPDAVMVRIDINSPKVRKSILHLLGIWSDQKTKSGKPHHAQRELDSVKRFLSSCSVADIAAFGLYNSTRLIGFSINELIPKSQYALSHYMKCDNALPGIYPAMMKMVSQELLSLGRKYINHEQDLGIPGLREAKNSYHPAFMLKKCKVRLHDSFLV